jgi:hypothetical protein
MLPQGHPLKSQKRLKTYQGLGFTFLAAAVDVDLLQWGAASLRKSLEP